MSDKELSDLILEKLKEIPKSEWAKATCEMNSWMFPRFMYEYCPEWWDDGKHTKAMFDRVRFIVDPIRSYIANQIPEKEISRYWNCFHRRDGMTPEEFETWWVKVNAPKTTKEFSAFCEAHNGKPERWVTLKVGAKGRIDGCDSICTIMEIDPSEITPNYAMFSIVESSLNPPTYFGAGQWVPLPQSEDITTNPIIGNKAICKVVDKIHNVGGLTLMPIGKGMLMPYHIPDSYEVVVDYNGKRKKMCVDNDSWFQSLSRGEMVEITFKKPWWKFGGITIHSMRKV